MPHLNRHDVSGVDIYDEREVVTRGSMAAQTSETFVRQIRVTPNLDYLLNELPLRNILNIATDEFECVASKCHAEVVPHNWGITIPRVQYGTEPHYSVVAEVSRIHPVVPDDMYAMDYVITMGYQRYNALNRDFLYTDQKTNQFRFGTVPGRRIPLSWLTDIDLLISPSRNRTVYEH